jgi:hypothetical protein
VGYFTTLAERRPAIDLDSLGTNTDSSKTVAGIDESAVLKDIKVTVGA